MVRTETGGRYGPCVESSRHVHRFAGRHRRLSEPCTAYLVIIHHVPSTHPLYHHPSTVLLLSTLLLSPPLHPHFRVNNPVSLISPPPAFIKFIIFASEIENGMARAGDPPQNLIWTYVLLPLRGIHEVGEGVHSSAV